MSYEIPLSQNEKHKIFDVLDSFEKEIDVEDKINHELSMIDSQSRNCWKNWDDDIITKSRRVEIPPKPKYDKDIPFSQKIISKLMNQNQRESDSEIIEEEDYDQGTSDDDVSNYIDEEEEEQMEYGSDNESESSTLQNYLNTKVKHEYIPSRFAKTPRENKKIIKTPSHNQSTSKSHTTISTKTPQTRQSAMKKANKRTFTKSDAAKLRQENIDLRAQLARLEAALDRTNMEKKRICEQIAQSKKTRAKQQAQIDYLKEQSLYGKKK